MNPQTAEGNRVPKRTLLLSSLFAVIAYPVAVVSIASARMEFAPLFAVVLVGIISICVSAPLLLTTIAITKDPRSAIPSVLCGLGAIFAQTEAYLSLLLLATTQIFILVLIGTATACLWNLQKNQNIKTNRNRVFQIALIILVMSSPVVGFNAGHLIGKLSGEGASRYLSDEQFLWNLTDNDMQRRWDTGWLLASEKPELLLRGVMNTHPDISRYSIEAVHRFKVHFVIEELERIAEIDSDENRRNRATQILTQIGNNP